MTNQEKCQQIIEMAYGDYLKKYELDGVPKPYTKKEFEDACKSDKDFGEKFGLTIEEEILTPEERYSIWFANNYETGFEYNPSAEIDFDNDYWEPTPTKIVYITYRQSYKNYANE